MGSLFTALPGAIGQGLIWGIMALGVFLTFRILDIADLTVDGSFATGGAISVMIIRAGFGPSIGLLAAVGVGILAGLVTAFLHTKCSIPAILAGILSQLGLYSVNLRIMSGRSNVAISVDKYNLLVSQRYIFEKSLKNPVFLLFLFCALLILLIYWFFGTEKGASIRATGANRNMARAQGINPDNDIIIGLAISNALVSLSGALVSQYQGSSDVNMGRGAIVIGLASVIIGEKVFGKVKGNFLSTLAFVILGSVIYYVVIQFVLLLGLNTNDLKLITALIVALFLAFPYWKTKYLAKIKKESNA